MHCVVWFVGWNVSPAATTGVHCSVFRDGGRTSPHVGRRAQGKSLAALGSNPGSAPAAWASCRIRIPKFPRDPVRVAGILYILC